jgi:dipeptidyl aminopeptidase/acylaminoacyl peptidase
MGASAGGLTALLLMARRPELCAAGIALFPVTDLVGLRAATHRFEAHYSDTIVGPFPAAQDRYRERSPLTVAGSIRAPLLLLHGSDDAVVPAEQSALLAARIREAGGTVEHHVYDGEGHGWRQPSTVEDELVRTTAFLERHVPVGPM